MANKTVINTFIFVFFVLASCSNQAEDITPVEVDKDNIVFASDVVFAAKCELRKGLDDVRDRFPDETKRFSFPTAITTMTLTVVGRDQPVSSINATIPAGGVVFTLNGARDLTRTSTKKMELTLLFSEGDDIDCTQSYREKNEIKEIEDEIGLASWLGSLVEIAKKTDEAPSFSSFEATFDIVETARGDATIAKAQTSAPRSFRFNASHTRSVSHKISITALICDSDNPAVNGKACAEAKAPNRQKQDPPAALQLERNIFRDSSS